MKTRFLIIIGMTVVVGMLHIPESFSEESVITHTVGQIEWLEWNIQSKIPVYKIQVTDQDMNENSDEIDKFNIAIWSDSDSVGIIVPTHETEKNSGIFYSIIYFSEEPSTGQRLRVSDGGVVTAKYDDRTLPSPSGKLEIFDTITIYYPVSDENQNPFIRIEDDSFTKQHLLTGQSMSPNPNDFRESGDSIGMLYAYSGLSLVGIIVGFFVIKKWKNRK
jgi:hypothetical protein